MTHFLNEFLRRPAELKRTIDFLLGAGRPVWDAAATAIRRARHVYLTGIGSSWHAALTAGPLFHLGGSPVYMQDAAYFLECAAIPPGSAIIVISRSGCSVEIVKLLAKVRNCGVTVIGITNSADGPLAKDAQIPIVVPVEMDHAISVNTYSTLAATVGILASAIAGSWNVTLATSLSRAVEKTASAIPAWQVQIAGTPWLVPGSVYYFLARGSSLGSCHETRLLWEEGVKSPATAMNTGSFHHGPQEMVAAGARFGILIEAERSGGQELAVGLEPRGHCAHLVPIRLYVPPDTQ